MRVKKIKDTIKVSNNTWGKIYKKKRCALSLKHDDGRFDNNVIFICFRFKTYYILQYLIY